jgi:trypsin
VSRPRNQLALAIALLAALSALAFSSVASAAVAPEEPPPSAAPGLATSVVNGEQAGHGSFPYLAFVTYRGGGVSEACTGTLVAANVVLTAAHCVRDEATGAPFAAAGFKVVTGNVNWEEGERVISAVSAVAVDPEYQPSGERSNWADAAVLQLAKPVAAPTVRLATAEAWGAGSAALIVGWGKTAATQSGPASTLHYGTTAVQSPTFCASLASHFDPAGQLCVLDAPAHLDAACNGDSGGPLLVVNPGTSSEPLEIGIASYVVEEGCSPASPQYFTRADLVAPWVNGQVAVFAATAATTDAATSAPTVSAAPGPLPRLSARAARRFARIALGRELGGRFGRRHGFEDACESLEATRRSCAVSWSDSAFRYAGTVTVFYALEANQVVWRYRMRVRRTAAACASRRCPARLFRA